MKPGLFIAIGYMPVLGDHAPPLLLLAGRFEEAFPPALLKTRTDARLVISPWSDHLLEAFDPVLVNAAVEAACAAVHKTPPAPPTAWLLATPWRSAGHAGSGHAGKLFDGFVSAIGSIPRTVYRWLHCCRLHAHPLRQVARCDTHTYGYRASPCLLPSSW